MPRKLPPLTPSPQTLTDLPSTTNTPVKLAFTFHHDAIVDAFGGVNRGSELRSLFLHWMGIYLDKVGFGAYINYLKLDHETYLYACRLFVELETPIYLSFKNAMDTLSPLIGKVEMYPTFNVHWLNDTLLLVTTDLPLKTQNG